MKNLEAELSKKIKEQREEILRISESSSQKKMDQVLTFRQRQKKKKPNKLFLLINKLFYEKPFFYVVIFFSILFFGLIFIAETVPALSTAIYALEPLGIILAVLLFLIKKIKWIQTN